MLVVLSPAKKLFAEPKAAPLRTQPLLLEEARKILPSVKALGEKGLMKLMEISPALATLNAKRFDDMTLGDDVPSATAAMLTFAGDTYLGLQASDFDEADLRAAQDRVVMLSGLYGVLRPFDVIEPYRLEMGSTLKVGRAKSLVAFWRPKISPVLAKLVEGHADNTVVNCASAEYFEAVDPKKLPGRVVTPVFLEEKAGKRTVIGYFAKQARGRMARFATRHRLERADDLKAFDLDGYRYVAEGSDDTRWLFVRG